METRGKLGALTDEVEKKRSQSADIDLEIGGKTGELDDLQNEIEQKILDLAAAKPNVKPCPRDWSPFGNEKERLLGTLRSFDPSLRDWALGSCGQG